MHRHDDVSACSGEIGGKSTRVLVVDSLLGTMGLNHMNGRVQDAISGRFISPGPFVTESGNTQNWNRYAYVYNNPLTYVDPSGFEQRSGSNRPRSVSRTLPMKLRPSGSRSTFVRSYLTFLRRITREWAGSIRKAMLVMAATEAATQGESRKRRTRILARTLRTRRTD